MQIKIIKDFGNSLKMICSLKNNRYYVYYYKENPNQNFVVNEEGRNITRTKEGMQALINCMNYIFYNT